MGGESPGLEKKLGALHGVLLCGRASGMGESLGDPQPNMPPLQVELSRSKVNCVYGDVLNCICSPLSGPVQPERDMVWAQPPMPKPAPLSRLSYFRAGSFCSCPGISRVSDIRGSGAEPLERRDSVVEHLQKDWIIQFKGRRSLFFGGSSKSPELLPNLKLSDLGHKCSAVVQGNSYQALCSRKVLAAAGPS